jgi:polyisoprenoid-binding protein YceI
MSKIALALAFSLSVLPALPAAATEWALDDTHTEIGFSVRHMMVTDVKGAFDKYTGVINIDDKDPTKSVVNVDIDVNSINTKVAKRDAHLKSPDFFDAANHPKMTFKSTKIEKGAKANTYKVTGDLTIRGTTKPVVLDVEVSDAWTDPKEWGGNVHRGVKATGKINRQDFGLKWQTKLDKGGVVAGDEVTLTINAELIEKKKA